MHPTLPHLLSRSHRWIAGRPFLARSHVTLRARSDRSRRSRPLHDRRVVTVAVGSGQGPPPADPAMGAGESVTARPLAGAVGVRPASGQTRFHHHFGPGARPHRQAQALGVRDA